MSSVDTTDDAKVRLTADLPSTEAALLKELAAKQRISITEALRRAIATEGLLQARRESGSKVLLEKNGQISELVFTR